MSNDIFEPVFRDGIGYCNVACQDYDWPSDNGESVRCACRDPRLICVPWVKSLLNPSIPNKKIQEAVQRLEMAMQTNCYGERSQEFIRTLIDAYCAELKKGTPMSTDNTVYVQKRGLYWYAWKGETIGPPKQFVGHETRPEAPMDAHDIAARGEGLVGHFVMELPTYLEPPSKTQAQKDAEWLRDNSNVLPLPTRLREIVARLEAPKE